MLLTLLLTLATGAAPTTYAAPRFNTARIEPELARFATDHFAQKLVDLGARVITAREMEELLGAERQRQLTGCVGSDSACSDELADALGADGLVLGDLGRVGQVLQLNVKVVRSRDAKKLASFSMRVPSEDQLLDALEQAAVAIAQQLGVVAPEKPQRPGHQAAWAVGGGGVLVLAAGGVCLGLAQGIHQQLLAPAVASGPSYDAAKTKSLVAQGTTLQTAGWVDLGVGAAALVGAGALFLFGPASGPQPVAWVSPGAGFVGVSGTWP
jgi:hypothetical protein